MRYVYKSIILVIFIMFALNNYVYGVNKSRKHNYTTSQKIEQKIINTDMSVSNIIKPYLTIDDWQLRQSIYIQLGIDIRFSHVSMERKKEMLETLIGGITDKYTSRTALRTLVKCDECYFSDKAKKMLEKYFTHADLQYYTILLYGIADLHNRDDEIQKLYQAALKGGYKIYEKEWIALLVMARRGEPAAVNSVIKETLNVFGYQGIKTNDVPEVIVKSDRNKMIINSFRANMLLDNVVYIRQPESIVLLWAFLNSDAKIGTNKNSPVAKLAIASLVKLIDDFPITSKKIYRPSEYTAEDVTTACKWMKENGWKTADSFKKKKTCAEKKAE